MIFFPLSFSASFLLSQQDNLMVELSQSNLLLAPYPTTIIDLKEHTVQQVCSFQTFEKLRKNKGEPAPHIPTKVPNAQADGKPLYEPLR